jgi:proline dehydrogenase
VSLARNALLWASKNRWIEGQFRRRSFAKKAVSRFMPGERPEDALREGKALAENGIPTVVTALGENLEHLDQAEQVKDHYLDVLAMIDDQGLETHISVKLTQLGLDLNPVVTMEHLRSLAAAAALRRNTLWVDIEESHYVDKTLELYLALRSEFSNVGLCLQSYLFRAQEDLDRVLAADGSVRLVKGAYNEPPNVAFPKKADTDENFFLMARKLCEHGAARAAASDSGNPWIRHGLGTHDLPLIRRIHEDARSAGWGSEGTEVQMLYGIRSGEQRALVREGNRVRVLISYGESWFPWYVRRLAERPANLGFVVKTMFNR